MTGNAPNTVNPGVEVETFFTVQGTEPPGAGMPQLMNGIPPPGGWSSIVPRSSPFSPQALSGDVTWSPVMFTAVPPGGEFDEKVAYAMPATMIETMTTAAKTILPG